MSINGRKHKPSFRPISVLLKPLAPSRQELILRVLQQPRQHVLSSVRTVAKEINADPATLLRTVQAMGFPTYRDFQRYLHELSVMSATPLDLMTTSDSRSRGIARNARDGLESAFKNLESLRNSLDLAQVERLTRHLYTAERILIIGGDLASALVWFLQYNLRILGLTVIPATSYGEIVHLTRCANARDVVIAISFRRGLRQTVEGLLQARAKKSYCVGITDTYLSSIARNSDQYFVASIESPSFSGSYVAPMALLDIVVVACAHYRKKRTLRILKEADSEQRTASRWYGYER